MAFVGLVGTLILTQFFLNSTFPYPEVASEGGAAAADGDLMSGEWRVWTLHTLISAGVFLVGMLGIQHNGRAFVDDASRLNL